MSSAAAMAQDKPALGGSGAAPAAKISVRPLPGHASTADTSRFPLTYCIALPTITPAEQWEKDYARYQRLLPPEIKKTQLGLDFMAPNGVDTWWCANSASPYAQLDTATRIADAQRLVGEWHGVANRLITHIDSFSIADQKFYRSVAAKDTPGPFTVRFTESKLELKPASLRRNRNHRNYVLLNQRYLLLYGTAKSSGNVSLVGLDPAGRLVFHTSTVVERKVRGQFLTYQTVTRQLICERTP
ncbi:hypothetical protein [Hymenobacter negativus]|uniref:Uncharacterized protein n=1 Tax=Hymenobacter negativus TaxID=2795026 RepID=A0ABS0QBC4_9BACT|nr:hypothetical protein [Hymenobacter negativus]MBH8559920.1 hypothetical protein [Hymenobacter negativus]